MSLGAINHVSITVSDLDKSKQFYIPIFCFLGYENTGQFPGVSIWESKSTGSAINLWQATPELKNYEHHDYAPGLHHLAFNAETKTEVNDFYKLLVKNKINVIDAPTEYDYEPGYYAVFFTDPDNIRIELAYTPNVKFCCNKSA